jgi:hypothetical protein
LDVFKEGLFHHNLIGLNQDHDLKQHNQNHKHHGQELVNVFKEDCLVFHLIGHDQDHDLKDGNQELQHHG